MFGKIVLFFATLFSKIGNFFKEKTTAVKKQVGEKWGKFTFLMKSYFQKKVKKDKTKENYFLYQIVFYPNEDAISIHTRSLLPEGRFFDCLNLRQIDETKPRRNSLYDAFTRIDGLKTASTVDGGYNLNFTRANSLFTWKELIPKILAALQIEVAGVRKLKEAGKPIDIRESHVSANERMMEEMLS